MTQAEKDLNALLTIQAAWNDPANNAQDIINAVGKALRTADYKLEF